MAKDKNPATVPATDFSTASIPAVVTKPKGELSISNKLGKCDFEFELDMSALPDANKLLAFMISACESEGIVMHDTGGIVLYAGTDAFCYMVFTLDFGKTGIPCQIGTQMGLKPNAIRVCKT